MTDSAEPGTDHADEFRESTVAVADGQAVQVEEYPGGDMTIYRSGGKSLYLSSEEASALRRALGQIDGSKGGATSDE